jgi:hypothetical protein
METHEESLKPFLTDEFLETLRLAVKTCGWNVDHVESSAFVRWCFDEAGKPTPAHEDLKPFKDW